MPVTKRSIKWQATSGIEVASENGVQEIMKEFEHLVLCSCRSWILKLEEKNMDKKTSELNMPTGTEELMAVNNPIESNSVVENPVVENSSISIARMHQQAKVNSVIHEWLTDMWLLTTGEELGEDIMLHRKQSGRPLAIACDGQIRLTESRPFAIDSLRAVGIEMQ
ncbi:MAG: hypothetical protein KA368_06790 [Acidobacteria bacterium]|nr:hypothetical protein [Acidobacteriota bacterium]